MLGGSGRRVLLVVPLFVIGLSLTAYLKYRTIPLSPSETHSATPRPPLLLQPSRFICLESRPKEIRGRRVISLHGADWTLESTVDLKCFPEREVVLSIETDRHFLPRPATHRIGFWIVKRGEAIYAKILESSGSEKLEMDALDLVTNHKCGIAGQKELSCAVGTHCCIHVTQRKSSQVRLPKRVVSPTR
jgi:hypothetical protein